MQIHDFPCESVAHVPELILWLETNFAHIKTDTIHVDRQYISNPKQFASHSNIVQFLCWSTLSIPMSAAGVQYVAVSKVHLYIKTQGNTSQIMQSNEFVIFASLMKIWEWVDHCLTPNYLVVAGFNISIAICTMFKQINLISIGQNQSYGLSSEHELVRNTFDGPRSTELFWFVNRNPMVLACLVNLVDEHKWKLAQIICRSSLTVTKTAHKRLSQQWIP